MTAAGNSGNTASRVAEFIYSKGRYVYGGYPDIDDPFLQQARERDVRKREALLHRIQQLTMDRVMFACPSWTTAHSAAWARARAEQALDSPHLVPYPAWDEMR